MNLYFYEDKTAQIKGGQSHKNRQASHQPPMLAHSSKHKSLIWNAYIPNA